MYSGSLFISFNYFVYICPERKLVFLQLYNCWLLIQLEEETRMVLLAFQRSVWSEKTQHIFDSCCHTGHWCLEWWWRGRNYLLFVWMVIPQILDKHCWWLSTTTTGVCAHTQTHTYTSQRRHPGFKNCWSRMCQDSCTFPDVLQFSGFGRLSLASFSSFWSIPLVSHRISISCGRQNTAISIKLHELQVLLFPVHGNICNAERLISQVSGERQTPVSYKVLYSNKNTCLHYYVQDLFL